MANIEKNDAWSRIILDEEAVASWHDENRRVESSDSERIAELAEGLALLFGFLARGYMRGTMDQRCWALLYSLRPEFLRGESMSMAAVRLGVTQQRLQTVLEVLRREVPGVPLQTDVRRGRGRILKEAPCDNEAS